MKPKLKIDKKKPLQDFKDIEVLISFVAEQLFFSYMSGVQFIIYCGGGRPPYYDHEWFWESDPESKTRKWEYYFRTEEGIVLYSKERYDAVIDFFMIIVDKILPRWWESHYKIEFYVNTTSNKFSYSIKVLKIEESFYFGNEVEDSGHYQDRGESYWEMALNEV